MRTPSDRELARATAAFERAGGVLGTSEALSSGIEERTLYWMRDAGLVEPLSRGIYHLSAMPLPAYPSVAAVLRRVPRAVLCLVSALEYHGIGTQIPAAVQIALPRGVKAPRIDYPRIERFSMSAEAMAVGVEERDMDGTPIRVFDLAKTVADCFKYRNRIGQDVAIEALQETIRSGRATPAQVMRYAKVDRVEQVMRPYIQALM